MAKFLHQPRSASIWAIACMAGGLFQSVAKSAPRPADVAGSPRAGGFWALFDAADDASVSMRWRGRLMMRGVAARLITLRWFRAASAHGIRRGDNDSHHLSPCAIRRRSRARPALRRAANNAYLHASIRDEFHAVIRRAR